MHFLPQLWSTFLGDKLTDPNATVTTPSGVVLKAGDPVITYVARNLEPYRGFHVFMRALEKIQKVDVHCHALIVGGDEVSYGKRPEGAANWREKMLAEVKLDPSRTHFLGRVPRVDYIKVLRVSAAHSYLTYPFVLSWSLLEALCCSAPVVASDTAPVREVVKDQVNGRLVPFVQVNAIAERLCDLLNDRNSAPPTRARARRDALRFNRAQGLVH